MDWVEKKPHQNLAQCFPRKGDLYPHAIHSVGVVIHFKESGVNVPVLYGFSDALMFCSLHPIHRGGKVRVEILPLSGVENPKEN